MTSEDVWDDNPPPGVNLAGTYITNPDSSFRHGDVQEDKPQLLYQSFERAKMTLWDDIKNNEWHYLTMYVSNF